MKLKTILFEPKEHIGWITFNQPEKLNVLSSPVLDELYLVLEAIEKNNDIRCVVLTGKGKAFVAGADINEMAQKDAAQARAFAEKGQRIFSFMEQLPQPVIASINGFALGGGCELACACDLRIASSNAKIGEPEVNLGIVPGFAGSVRLPRLIGLSHAKRMILLGEALKAEEAEKIGLLHRVVQPEQLKKETLKIAQELSAKSKTALAGIKKLLFRSLKKKFSEAESFEAEVFADCFLTHDQKEGMNAFLEKRKPKFEGL